MDMYEFGKLCQSLNGRYKELFGYIPLQTSYSCTREEYIEALSLAISEQKEIFHFLPGLAREEQTIKEGEYQWLLE